MGYFSDFCPPHPLPLQLHIATNGLSQLLNIAGSLGFDNCGAAEFGAAGVLFWWGIKDWARGLGY